MYINSYGRIVYDDDLTHYGVKGMKWRKRRPGGYKRPTQAKANISLDDFVTVASMALDYQFGGKKSKAKKKPKVSPATKEKAQKIFSVAYNNRALLKNSISIVSAALKKNGKKKVSSLKPHQKLAVDAFTTIAKWIF